MTAAQSLITFIAAAGLLTLVPGVDTALVVRAAMVEGRRPACLAAIGIGLGCMAWGAAVALGLGAIVSASPVAFTALKWLGAGYLLYLGAMLLLKPRRTLAVEGQGNGASTAKARGPLDPLRRGLLTNLLNPKVGVFYISFLPQFTPAGTPMAPWVLMLACLHVALGLIWFTVLIAATIPISRWMARPGLVTAIDRLTGCVFIGFGARLAVVR